MALAADEILKLFDSYWFEHDIISGNKILAYSAARLVPQDQHEAQESTVSSAAMLRLHSCFDEDVSSPRSVVVTAPKLPKMVSPQQHEPEESKVTRVAMLRVHSLSDQCLRIDNSFYEQVSSPRSVITAPKLPKIISGTELCDLDKEIKEQDKNDMLNRRWRSKGISRSLSDLEINELKGFMDLGFVFTEEDKTSSLVSIIPGLQRWGGKGTETPKDEEVVSRPYLSEAWGDRGKKRINKTVVPWRFPDLKNDNTMKDHLKAWAHTVASTVR